MRKYILAVAIAIVFAGCAGKAPVEYRYVEDKIYRFEKIDLDGVYVDTGSKDVQRVCTPILNEMNTIYKGAISFYVWQIDEYNKVQEGDIDDTRREK